MQVMQELMEALPDAPWAVVRATGSERLVVLTPNGERAIAQIAAFLQSNCKPKEVVLTLDDRDFLSAVGAKF